MNCPSLNQLPTPPPNKTGWPWTEESPSHPAYMPDGSDWPSISIVTPSYNQGQFIEETIRSVLLQGYPNLEYIVIDGGSTDNSVEIIKKYEPWLTYWVSEQDKGQAHAINKGLEQATGAIAAYLNSDDTYLLGALAHVSQGFQKTNADILVGKRPVHKPKLYLCRRSWWKQQLEPYVYPFIFDHHSPYQLPQECIFWNHTKYRHLKFEEQYHFCLDVWWFIQIFSGAKVVHTTRRLGDFRLHPESKTSRLQMLARAEIEKIIVNVEPYRKYVTEEVKQQIRSSYCRESKFTVLKKVFQPFRDFYFIYYHPQYLPQNH